MCACCKFSPPLPRDFRLRLLNFGRPGTGPSAAERAGLTIILGTLAKVMDCFDDDEAATLAWLNALVAACPRATRPEDISPSPRLSRLPPPGFFTVTPESADQTGSVPPSVAADGVVTWEVSEDPEAFAVATSRDGASAAGLSRFDSAPFALRDRWWQLRLTVDTPANTCGVHLLAAGVPEKGGRRQDEAGEQGIGEEQEEEACASFTLKLEA